MTDAIITPIEQPARSYMGNLWRQFRAHPGGVAGLIVFVFIVLAVYLGPFIHTIDPNKIDIRAKNQGPSWAHPFGTDNLGHDMLAQVMAGGQISLAVGITAMLLALVLGTLVGVVSGYYRRLDGLLMRITDLFLALPLLPLLLVIIMLFRDTLRSAFGPESGIFILIVFVIGVTSWMHTARIVRGDVLAVKSQEFILAAKSSGMREYRVILKHILPNVMSSIMVSATLGIASAIITESALSFLGLGIQPPLVSLGSMVGAGRDYVMTEWWIAILPGIVIFILSLSISLIGDYLRDVLDPTLH